MHLSLSLDLAQRVLSLSLVLQLAEWRLNASVLREKTSALLKAVSRLRSVGLSRGFTKWAELASQAAAKSVCGSLVFLPSRFSGLRLPLCSSHTATIPPM